MCFKYSLDAELNNPSPPPVRMVDGKPVRPKKQEEQEIYENAEKIKEMARTPKPALPLSIEQIRELKPSNTDEVCLLDFRLK